MVIDPGIGFAKDTAQNVALLAATERFTRLAPVLIGVSRKRFISELAGEPMPTERVGGSVGDCGLVCDARRCAAGAQSRC